VTTLLKVVTSISTFSEELRRKDRKHGTKKNRGRVAGTFVFVVKKKKKKEDHKVGTHFERGRGRGGTRTYGSQEGRRVKPQRLVRTRAYRRELKERYHQVEIEML